MLSATSKFSKTEKHWSEVEPNNITWGDTSQLAISDKLRVTISNLVTMDLGMTLTTNDTF